MSSTVGRRGDSLRLQLSQLETELSSRLRRAMQYAAQGGSPAFTAPELDPHEIPDPPPALVAEPEELVRLSREALRLRRSLGLPVAGSPGDLFLGACEEASDTSDPHRLLPRERARRILRDLDRLRTASWSLWRLDDNGNRFEISRHASPEEAEALAREFEARGHKQHYYVRPSSHAAPHAASEAEPPER